MLDIGMYSKHTAQAIFGLVEYLRKPGGNPKHSKATEIVCDWWFPSNQSFVSTSDSRSTSTSDSRSTSTSDSRSTQLSLVQVLTMLLNLTLHKINYSPDLGQSPELSEYYQQVHEFLTQLAISN